MSLWLPYSGFRRDIGDVGILPPPVMENEMEKKMEDEMETGVEALGFKSP